MRFLVFLTAACAWAQPYLDPRQPIERRVEDLLARMTLEEKVGQMNMPCVYRAEMGGGATNTGGAAMRHMEVKAEACRKFAAGAHLPGLGPGGGFFTLADNILPEGPRRQAEFFNELQRIALEKTRLKIPLLQSEEGTHGLMCAGGTVFPEGPAIGSAWNTDLVERIYAAAAREARAVGIHQLFTLVVEPIRDPRLGRNEEAYSEDPYLCARYAEAIVRGAQGKSVAAPDKVVAGLCHYPGQSQPVSGLERGAMEISERTLREVFLPPWVAGIRKMGALGVMATYPAIDGIPTHGSVRLLTSILRDELRFEGLVLGEGQGLTTLLDEHTAADQKEAGILALRAGVDVGISYEPAYMLPLIEAVKEGRAPMALVDRAVRRILALKFRLGLFDRRFVDVNAAVTGPPRERHRELALEAAREGVVLLRNEKNLLPLARPIRRIAVIGPNADDERNQLGDYTSKTILQPVVTVLKGLQRKLGGESEIVHVKGCEVTGTRLDQIAEAAAAARSAQVAVVVVGEARSTNGEGKDVASLDLSGRQQELVQAVHATGTPTVVVLINGRALSTPWLAERVPAIIEAWLPGEQGGAAIADVLFGDYNPSGRLPVSVPRHSGQLPVYYNHSFTKEARSTGRFRYVDMPATPLWPFGHGLSYTRFEYSGLVAQPERIAPGGKVRIATTVRNTGSRAGAEVVQLYLQGAIGRVTRPVKELKGFRKVFLAAGESRQVEFELTRDELASLDENLHSGVAPGRYLVMVGASSADIRLKGSFTVAQP